VLISCKRKIEANAGNPEAAITAWQAYLANRPDILDAYSYEQIGDFYSEIGIITKR